MRNNVLIKFFIKNDNWKHLYLSCLYQRDCTKKFIQCSKTSWHYNESIRVFHQQCFSQEKIFDINPFIQIRIVMLLMWQDDVATNTSASNIFCPSVCSFHNSRAATGHNGKTKLGNFT